MRKYGRSSLLLSPPAFLENRRFISNLSPSCQGERLGVALAASFSACGVRRGAQIVRREQRLLLRHMGRGDYPLHDKLSGFAANLTAFFAAVNRLRRKQPIGKRQREVKKSRRIVWIGRKRKTLRAKRLGGWILELPLCLGFPFSPAR
jgi:hypothetical protein